MADEETTTPSLIDPSVAVASFMEWLQQREIASGPFSAHYNAEAGNALVDKFCAAQGWIAVFLDDEQIEQVKTLREKYPE